MNKSLYLSCIVVLIAACATPENKLQTPDLLLLKQLMTGSFSSAEQAVQDKEYLDVRLRMAPIWPDRA